MSSRPPFYSFFFFSATTKNKKNVYRSPGLLTMANSGLHTNGSQFYITTAPAGHLDGRSVAFGRVTKGLEVVRAVYGMYSIRGKPVSEITVEKSGEL